MLWSILNLSSDVLGIGPGGFLISSGEFGLVTQLEQQSARAPREPLCIFDVGAHHGEFLEAIAPSLSARGIPFSIHAFEPSRSSFEELHRRHGSRANWRLNNTALGREPDQLPLYANTPGSPLGSFSRRRLDHFSMQFDHTETVSVSTLDAYCAGNSIERIDLLKIDVEGHELDVMQGGVRLFAERRIRLMTFEFGGANIDSRTYFQDYWYFIKEKRIGDIYRLTPSGYLAPVTQYNELYEQFRPTNYLVVCPPD